MLTIGRIEYANCFPIFSEFSRRWGEEYRFVDGVPSHLNALLATGSIDVSPSSSIEYARCPEKYLLFPDLSISAFGPVRSVLLLSPVPLQEMGGRDVAVTSDSATSVVLLKILLRKYVGIRNHFITFEGTDCDVPSAPVLLIGDAALSFSHVAPFPYRYDLGELWFKFTQSPFVFGLWIVNRLAVEREREQLRECARRFVEARWWASMHYPDLSRRFVSPLIQGVDLVSYWESISYEFGESHRQGLMTFYRDAVEIGELDEIPPLRFVEIDESFPETGWERGNDEKAF